MTIPITTVLKIKPIVGLEEECLQWMQSTGLLVSEYEGFLSREIYKSIDQEAVLVTIFTFDSKEHLDTWENSKDRINAIEKRMKFVESVVEKKQLTGFEFLFENSAKVNTTSVKWKMLVLTIAIIFILLNTFIPFVQFILSKTGLPILLKSLIGIAKESFNLYMPKKIELDETIDNTYQKLMQIWRPAFGNQDDIAIYNYAERLMLKSTTNEQINSIKTKMIYLLKKRLEETGKTGQLSKRGV